MCFTAHVIGCPAPYGADESPFRTPTVAGRADRYAVPLPRPDGIHRITSHVVLPPTSTAQGPVSWAQPPQRDTLGFCREIDVLAALRTALA